MSWSPDGRHVAFTADTGRIPRDLFIIGSDGADLTKLTESLPSGEFFMFEYDWSQDGTSIFFITNRNQQAFQNATSIATVYKANADSSVAVINQTADRRIIDWWNGTTLLDNPEDTLTWLRPDGSQSTLDLCQNSLLLGIAQKRSYSGNMVVGSNCSDDGWMFYWANSDGTTIDQLLNSPISLHQESLFNLTWSLDDQYIAFVSLDTASPDVTETLYVLDVAKAREDPSIQPLKMTNSFGPSWQPVSNTELVEEKAIPEPTQTVMAEDLPPIGTGKENGEWIAFIGTTMVPDPTGSTALTDSKDVYLIHQDGSGLVNLTNSPDDYFWPEWSPNGKHLLFLRSTGTIDILRKTEPTGFEVLVRTGMSAEMSPDKPFEYSWSPNNEQVAYIDNQAGNSDIYTVYANGRDETQRKQLTNDPGQDVGFAWSPDGSQIAFQRLEGDKLSIFIMNEDGSDQREVAHGSGKVELEWSNDGSSIYASSAEDNWLECEGCIAKPAIYRIQLNEPSVQQIYYEEDTSKVAGWYLYDTPQNTLYFMRINRPVFVEFWGTWFHADGNSVTEIGELDPHQTCKTTTGNILNEDISPTPRFSIISNFCAGGFDLYLADREATPKKRFIHLLQLPLDTWGQGGDFATLPMTWSPDGRWLIYDDGNGTMYLLDLERAIQNPDSALTPLIEPSLFTGVDGQLYQSSETISVFDLVWQPSS